MAMQFTSLPGGNRPDTKAAKLALVAAVHVAEAGWARLAFVWKLD
jgi:hypothetical protein